MTQEELIDMARRAGFIDADWNIKIVLPHLEAFANWWQLKSVNKFFLRLKN